MTLIIRKIIFIFALFLVEIIFKSFRYNNYGHYNLIYNDYKMEEQIEKELAKIEPNYSSLSWDNVKSDLEILANKYKYLIKNEKNIEEDSPIWVMWYQGIENAPDIVKSCIQSLIANRAKHPVYILSQYNLNKYIKLPSHIIEKYEQKIFSIQQFSDIIRFALLFKYGGYWIDSTFFLTTPLIKVNVSYFTLKLQTCFTNSHPFVKCLWGGNFFAVGKNSFLATYGYMAFLQYWKKYNSLIEYFFIDYIIHIAYITLPEFKQMITDLPFVTCNIFTLQLKLGSDFDKSYVECPFNKLAKDKKANLYNGDKITNYGYIIENYKLDIKNNSKDYKLNI